MLHRLPDFSIAEAACQFQAGIRGAEPLLAVLAEDLKEDKDEAHQQFDGRHDLGILRIAMFAVHGLIECLEAMIFHIPAPMPPFPHLANG